jgi:hypothetical protein
VANCSILGFGPKMTMRLSGGVGRRGNPAIHTQLTMQPGGANLRRVSVTLPKGELLDNSHIGTVCTRVDFANNSCSERSLVGHAEVATPLLAQPLEGSAYLRASDNELPDLALDLEGQVDIEAAARIDSVNGRLRATFESLPDLPISSVSLDLVGGSKGVLQNSIDLCGTGKQAKARMTGQNGARLDTSVKLQIACRGFLSRRHERARREHAQRSRSVG